MNGERAPGAGRPCPRVRCRGHAPRIRGACSERHEPIVPALAGAGRGEPSEGVAGRPVRAIRRRVRPAVEPPRRVAAAQPRCRHGTPADPLFGRVPSVAGSAVVRCRPHRASVPANGANRRRGTSLSVAATCDRAVVFGCLSRRP